MLVLVASSVAFSHSVLQLFNFSEANFPADHPHTQDHLGYFLTTFRPNQQPTILRTHTAHQHSDDATNPQTDPPTPPTQPPSRLPTWLKNTTHYRLIPGIFQEGMKYHFDGLATLLKFSFDATGGVSYFGKPYTDDASTNYKECLFFGTGTGPTLGNHLCFNNPGVNLLPFQDELWLTIDTSRWGRVDPVTLDTIIGAKVEVPSLVLNAHPACDRETNECFVQHPCPVPGDHPWSDSACFSVLGKGEAATNLKTTIISKVTIPNTKIIQHSHSPCVTTNFVVSKLDAFTFRNPLNSNWGLLKFMHQSEDSLWMVMDRKTKTSRLLRSKADVHLGGGSFVNNHFWNCFEDSESGDIVVETVAATQDYLDNYFERNLNKQAEWDKLFYPALRCRIPATSNSTIPCEPMLSGDDSKVLFDYPTFNPWFKMNEKYRFVYAIAPVDTKSSKWFDRAIKIDAKTGRVIRSWSAPGVFLTEFDFVPRTKSIAREDEDDGVLLTVLYNATSQASQFAVFDAKEMVPISLFAMEGVVPFHAHGISCLPGEPCFSNP